MLLESQHPGGLEKIQYLEDASRYKRTDVVDEMITTKPRFITKPKSIDNLRERGHAHFECKLEPVTDSNLKVKDSIDVIFPELYLFFSFFLSSD